jgi:integrase
MLKTCAVPRGRPGAFDHTVFLGRRDEVVFRLLLDTGGRVSELCGLDLTDVDLDREVAYVTGKGSRPGWCRSARRAPRRSTVTCGCAPCTLTRALRG